MKLGAFEQLASGAVHAPGRAGLLGDAEGVRRVGPPRDTSLGHADMAVFLGGIEEGRNALAATAVPVFRGYFLGGTGGL